MKVRVFLPENEIREAIADYVRQRCGISLKPVDVKIDVKSKQNYRSEWEQADIRCDFEAIQ